MEIVKIGNKRAHFIDYRNPGIFLITMNKNPGISSFSKIWVDNSISHKKRRIKLHLSPIGYNLAFALRHINKRFSKIRCLRNVVMPDHTHFIIEIVERLEISLEDLLLQFQKDFTLELNQKGLISKEFENIFEEGFNDQFLKHSRNLDVMFEYLRDNPYRLHERLENPNFFTRNFTVDLKGDIWTGYGNSEILNNPFIYPVIFHSRYTYEEYRKKMDLWLYAIENGGVLAGAFIHPKEKEFLKIAFEKNAKVILFSNHVFEEREKPTGQLFEHCAKGSLLILSKNLSFLGSREGKITRKECQYINATIERIF